MSAGGGWCCVSARSWGVVVCECKELGGVGVV